MERVSPLNLCKLWQTKWWKSKPKAHAAVGSNKTRESLVEAMASHDPRRNKDTFVYLPFPTSASMFIQPLGGGKKMLYLPNVSLVRGMHSVRYFTCFCNLSSFGEPSLYKPEEYQLPPLLTSEPLPGRLENQMHSAESSQEFRSGEILTRACGNIPGHGRGATFEAGYRWDNIWGPVQSRLPPRDCWGDYSQTGCLMAIPTLCCKEGVTGQGAVAFRKFLGSGFVGGSLGREK